MRESDIRSPSVLAGQSSRGSACPAVREPSAAFLNAIDGRWVVGLGFRPTKFQAIESLHGLQGRIAFYPHA